MDWNTQIVKVKELVEKAKDIVVVTHENPTFDSVGSVLSMYMGLTGLGKNVTVVCPSQITVGLSNFVGVNKIATEMAKKNFIVSLDYVEGSIEKVSYNIEGDKFNLVIEPKSGFGAFSSDKVKYSWQGSAADLIFTIDTIHLGGLGKIYETDKDLFASKPIVNIDRHPNNTHFGQLNFVEPKVSSTVELTAIVLSSLGVKLTVDIATNILNAIYEATDNFQALGVTSRTFDLTSACIKAGAKRFGQGQMGAVATPGTVVGQSQSPQGVVQSVQQTTAVQPTVVPQPVEPQPVVSQGANQQVANQPAMDQSDRTVEVKPQEAPAEWLKPKIFKSSQPVSQS